MVRISRFQFSAAFLGLATILSFSCAALGDASIEGRVSQVTLYRGQAQVTRIVPIENKAGSLEVVVGKLPEQIVPDSLFAEGGDAIAAEKDTFGMFTLPGNVPLGELATFYGLQIPARFASATCPW